MVFFPNCKINIGLNVVEKRADGFHNIETIFYPIPLTDAVEIISSNLQKEINYSSTGFFVGNNEEKNLCVKAYRLLKKDFTSLPNINLHLHKAIPMGAGLGGGSADGSFVLTLLNKKYQLNLTTEQLINYAAQLGSDCPFFIINKPCYATSRGEVLEQIEVDLSSYKIVLVNPQIHINTAWAFSQITPQKTQTALKQIISQPIQTWKENITNDFEKVVFETHPSIQKIKNDLYNYGAVFASMSGTGSTVYGIFNKEENLQLTFAENYFVKEINL